MRGAVCAHARFDQGEASLGCRHSRPIPGVSVSGMLGSNKQVPRVNLSLSSVSRKLLDRRPQPRTRPSTRPRAWRGAAASSLPRLRSKQGKQRPLRDSLQTEPAAGARAQRGLTYPCAPGLENNFVLFYSEFGETQTVKSPADLCSSLPDCCRKRSRLPLNLLPSFPTPVLGPIDCSHLQWIPEMPILMAG